MLNSESWRTNLGQDAHIHWVGVNWIIVFQVSLSGQPQQIYSWQLQLKINFRYSLFKRDITY